MYTKCKCVIIPPSHLACLTLETMHVRCTRYVWYIHIHELTTLATAVHTIRTCSLTLRRCCWVGVRPEAVGAVAHARVVEGVLGLLREEGVVPQLDATCRICVYIYIYIYIYMYTLHIYIYIYTFYAHL